jgi:hypothetical protein
MGKVHSALILYLAAILVYVMAVLFGSDNLELLIKPIIIPSVYYSYYISVKGKISFLFSFSILSYFFAEILLLISASDFLYPGLFCFGIPYLIITYFLAQDFLYYLKKRKYTINNFSFYIIIILLFYMLYNVLSFINESSKLEFSFYIFNGILLFVMGIFAFLIQFNFNNKTILYMVLMVVFFIISDLFFIFSKSTKDLIALKLISIITQQLSYFFYVCYFIYRTKTYSFKK